MWLPQPQEQGPGACCGAYLHKGFWIRAKFVPSSSQASDPYWRLFLPGGLPRSLSGRYLALQRSRKLQQLLLEQQNARATFLDAATDASGATGRSCDAYGRCYCRFQSHYPQSKSSRRLLSF